MGGQEEVGIDSEALSCEAVCRRFQSGKHAAKETPKSRRPESNYRSYKKAMGSKARCGGRSVGSGAKKVGDSVCSVSTVWFNLHTRSGRPVSIAARETIENLNAGRRSDRTPSVLPSSPEVHPCLHQHALRKTRSRRVLLKNAPAVGRPGLLFAVVAE